MSVACRKLKAPITDGRLTIWFSRSTDAVIDAAAAVNTGNLGAPDECHGQIKAYRGIGIALRSSDDASRRTMTSSTASRP
jgi:hypothetical protein